MRPTLLLAALALSTAPLRSQGAPPPLQQQWGVDANDPGILEPCLSWTNRREIRIPHTDQALAGVQRNLVGPVTERDARGAPSLFGHAIQEVRSPHEDLRQDLDDLARAARDGRVADMQAVAIDLADILQGSTQGRIYDGFALLNLNRGAFVPDHVAGEYKMKALRDSGLTGPGIDGQPRRIWEVDVNYLVYDGQFDSDTFLLRVPVAAHPFDTLRVHYRIYSLEREDFAPTAVMMDDRLDGSVQFPFKGFDSVWVPVNGGRVTEFTVDFPPLRLLRGVYTWGWRVHPPRIHFLQPVFEIVNVHTGRVELEPQGQSFALRNAALDLDGIGSAAPEKKAWQVAQAVLQGASPAAVEAMLTDPGTSPRGTWQEWADLASDQRQLPPEAWDVLAAEGIPQGSFGPYRFVTVYLNNEMYGDGPRGERIQGWRQGERFPVKVINLDDHDHFYRVVDFGPKLHDDLRSGGFPAASHSFEIMNFKPMYGAPKVAEVQWRAAWGFRPHFDVIQQPDVFSRGRDRMLLEAFYDGHGFLRRGYRYSGLARGGDFLFNPPPFIIGTEATPSPQPLREGSGTPGLVVGLHTEGFGVAKMCSHANHPLGDFCKDDLSAYNPYGVKNVDLDGNGTKDVLWFPPFLRNPDPVAGGDIIPPTPAWKPFLWLNPANGTLWLDPSDPAQGAWADLTYAHGSPVPAGGALTATLEAPRAFGQVFYQFDDLHHDNAIFSPHPTF